MVVHTFSNIYCSGVHGQGPTAFHVWRLLHPSSIHARDTYWKGLVASLVAIVWGHIGDNRSVSETMAVLLSEGLASIFFSEPFAVNLSFRNNWCNGRNTWQKCLHLMENLFTATIRFCNVSFKGWSLSRLKHDEAFSRTIFQTKSQAFNGFSMFFPSEVSRVCVWLLF